MLLRHPYFHSTTMTHRGSRVVLVENIAYELTEDQLIEVFKEVGPVASFKLIFDRDSGRPKGYGYCEYYDAETAASAVRNLNNYELEGRLLRVDFAADADPQLSSLQSQKSQQLPAQQQTLTTLPSMNPAQMLDVIVHMKTLVHSSPDQARTFLAQNPQLTYALFQSMVTLGIADTAIVHRILAQQYAPPPQNIVSTQPVLFVPASTPITALAPVPALVHSQVRPQYVPTYPVFPQQPSIPQIPFQPNPLVDVQDQQKALLMQVLQLTQQQIDTLPPEQRQNVIALKQQILMSQQPH